MNLTGAVLERARLQYLGYLIERARCEPYDPAACDHIERLFDLIEADATASPIVSEHPVLESEEGR